MKNTADWGVETKFWFAEGDAMESERNIHVASISYDYSAWYLAAASVAGLMLGWFFAFLAVR